MGQHTCVKCDRKFFISDTNPNLHYSTPSDICERCELQSKLKVGEWYTDKNGEHVQKT